ncbi:PHD finger protein 20 isoform X3 [Sardina pilchardus]|uniref:PHD finger protein 20 isoform X3 n=1 Tax=Sardina pilchardus TaxID=27697 RepID=UPI002E0E3883
MNKTPPNRRGITFEVGAQLEARDSLKNWYAASIEKIDFDDEKVLIHYRQWSHRYDEWFDWASPYLRPVERIQLRREGLQDEGPTPVRAKPNQLPSTHSVGLEGFRVNDKVLASWSDCRFYPATVLAVNKDASYTVKFYDNVVQTVKGIHVKPYTRSGRYKGKPRVMDRTRERSSDRKNQSGRERKPPENRALKGKRSRPSSSDQDGESNTDEEEEEEDEDEGHWHREEQECAGVELLPVSLMDEERKPEMEEEEEDTRLAIGNEGMKTNGETDQKGSAESNGVAEASSHHGGGGGNGGRESKEEGHAEETREPGTPDSGSGKEDGNGSGVRKRRVSVEQACPSKKSKADNLSEHGLHNGTTPHTEASNQNLPTAQVSAPTEATPAQPSNNAEAQKAEGQSVVPAPPIKPVRKQGFHNPNRFSREPLYRVVKNQPPPVLSINLDHNAFKCSVPGCTKSFRKAKLLHYHMKYYHGEEKPLEGELSPSTGGPKQAGEKQAAPVPRDSPKRRRTISASMHSSQHSPSRTPTSPRSDAKAGVLFGEKRRTSAPPIVDIQLQLQQQHQYHQQRPSLKEKSKENLLERNIHANMDRDRDRSPIDIVCLKEREKPKDKKPKDFLRIKLKKKKKKKRSKSDEDYATDWSTDSCGWSEEEADCGATDPFLSDDSAATGTRGSEIVRCVCEAEEDNDFMIQCEECLCWQHGTCMGLLEDNVPDKYTCYICRDPPGQRQSLRYWYDREWLSSGHMYGLSFLKENYSHQNARKITTTHQLLGDVQQVLEVLNGLQLKISVLQSQTHPDLRLWCQPWRPAGKAIKKEEDLDMTTYGGHGSEVQRRAQSTSSSSMSSSVSSSCSSPLSSRFQDAFISYISSEHCYQKPRALVVEKRGGSYMDADLHAYDTQRPHGRQRSDQESDCGLWGPEVKVKQEEEDEYLSSHNPTTPIPTNTSSSSAQQQQWQANLLDHIESVQDEVCHRMDFIERELDMLESCLDYTGELEPPEPLTRLPQLKHRIKELLSELGKVQQIALSCTT